MNYLKHYNNLITTRLKNITQSDYYELHHIKPKSLGGNDSKENIIKLTAREHYIAHLLLAKIYGGKMWYALFIMSVGKAYNNKRTYKVKSKIYEFTKREMAKITSIRVKANPIINIYTDELREKISKASKDRWANLDYKNKIIQSRQITHNNQTFKDNQREKAKQAIDNMTKDEFREKYINSRPFRKEIKCVYNGIETIYLSLRDASRALKIERKTMQISIKENREISKGKFQGYRFEYTN